MTTIRIYTQLIAVLLLAINLISADELKVSEFRELISDFKAVDDPVLDLDKNYCTVIRIDGDIPHGLTLQQKVYKSQKISAGELYFYISSKEKDITLVASGLKSLTIPAPEGSFQMGTVYYLRLILEESASKSLPVLISSEPDGATIKINGKKVGFTNEKLELEPGSYQLLISKAGYENLSDLIKVTPNQKNIFQYRLKSNSPQATVLPKTVQSGDIILFEDFEDENLNGWIKLSGEWAASGGQLLQVSTARPAIILTGNEKLKNFTLEVDARKSSGEEGFMVVIGSKLDNATGIIWSMGQYRNTKSVLMSSTDFVNRHRYKLIDGSKGSFKVENNKWYKLKVEVKGTQVRCFIDGILLVDYGVPEMAVSKTGRIGLGAFNTKVTYDNLKITRIP